MGIVEERSLDIKAGMASLESLDVVAGSPESWDVKAEISVDTSDG